MFLLFPIVATLLFAFLNYYIYSSIKGRFCSYKNFKKLHKILIAFILILMIAEIIFLFGLRFNVLLKNNLIYKISIFATATTFCLFCVCALYDVLNVSIKIPNFSQSRRKFLKFVLDITFIIAAFSYLFKGFFNAVKIPKITEVDIKIKNLKRETNFVVVSDIHLGEYLKKDFLDDLVSEILKTDHEAVFIVGDMLDLKAHELGDILEPLKRIEKPVFFVTGNHEYYSGVADLIKALRDVGIHVLDNECVELDGIDIIGVNDRRGARWGVFEPDLQKALRDSKMENAKILLAHQPKFVVENVKDEIDLCICGHTHAGQIFPFNLLVMLDQKYVYGLYNDGLKQIYVTSGAGFWGPPVRIFADSEIALLKLKKD